MIVQAQAMPNELPETLKLGPALLLTTFSGGPQYPAVLLSLRCQHQSPNCSICLDRVASSSSEHTEASHEEATGRTPLACTCPLKATSGRLQEGVCGGGGRT